MLPGRHWRLHRQYRHYRPVEVCDNDAAGEVWVERMVGSFVNVRRHFPKEGDILLRIIGDGDIQEAIAIEIAHSDTGHIAS